jgi:hypothetical protein
VAFAGPAEANDSNIQLVHAKGGLALAEQIASGKLRRYSGLGEGCAVGLGSTGVGSAELCSFS